MSFSIQKLILVGLVLAIGLGLRLYRLGEENFWVDEVVYVQDASGSPGDLVNYSTSTHTRLRQVTPLPHLLTHFLVSPGNTERTVRLPSAIFGTLEVVVLFAFASQLFSFSIGLLAALLLALSPLHVWYSQEARWYAQWSFLTTCTYLALFYAWKNNRVTSWIGYGLTTVLNLYTFVYSSLVAALQAIAVWWSRGAQEEPRRFALKFFSVQLLAAGAALPILWMVLGGLDKSSGTPRPVGLGDLPFTFFAYAAGFSAGPTLAELHALPSMFKVIAEHPVVLVFFAVYFPLIVLGLRKTIHNPVASALVLPWLFGLPVLVFLIASATNLTYQVRYTLPSLAAFILVVSCGVSSLQSKTGKVGFMSAIVLCSLFSLGNFYWNGQYDKEHVRAAISRIREMNGSKSPILSVGQIGGVAKYYGGRLDIINVGQNRCDVAATEYPLRQRSSDGTKRIWVIAGRDWDNRATTCLRELSRSYSVIDHQRFTGVDLWLFKQRE